jgi:Amt family ammonium transporter
MKQGVKLGMGISAAALLMAIALVPAEVWAQAAATPAPATPAKIEPKLDTGDTAWMLTSSALVLLMTVPGVALFYGGLVRKKNVLATVMQSFATTCLITVLWMICGYSLAFSAADPAGSLIGTLDNLLLKGITVEKLWQPVTTAANAIPESVFMMFQLTFAIITPALIAGSVAERMRFSALLWFIGLWSLLVYVPIAYWVWGGGFLKTAGILDFAGGTVVHINSGVAAFVACLVLGKRVGHGKEAFMPHNLTLTVIGASFLWVGWFGFNAGSAVAANGAAGMAMAVTQIATAAAALAWMLAEWASHGEPSLLGIASGAVAGLVAITPASGFVGPGAALVLGIVAGVVCFWACTWLKNKLGYDDALDVFGVHGIGGIVGALLTGVFASKAIGGDASIGLLEGNPGQVVTQAYGVLVTLVYSGVVSFFILKIVGAVVPLRVDEESEREGLDIRLHGESVA